MSDYLKKIDALRAKQKELIEKELELIESRKNEVATLLEKMGLLTVSDAILVAALSAVLHAIETDDKATLATLEKTGAQILNANNRRKVEKITSLAASSGATHATIDNAHA